MTLSLGCLVKRQQYNTTQLPIMSCHCASADLLLGSAWARVDGEGAAWLVGSLKLGLAACVIGEPPSLPEGLLVKKGTVAPRRFQPALIDVAAAEICTTHSP